jgi:ABC-2 type transport system ATP-binding protein
MDKPAISIEKLSKTFIGKKRTRVEALKNLSLSVGRGEVFGFLGPNGAGKSTTIKCLLGLLSMTSGNARIMDVDISHVESRRLIGYLPENPAFYEYLSAEEYLQFVGKTFGMGASDLREKSDEILHLMDLWDARKRSMRGYSKGMVQRVGLAQTLIHDPAVYILDEPMSGLDPIGRALVKKIILDLKRRGKSVFFSTHITSDVESVCDRVGVIVKGEMRCVRNVDEITVGGITGYEVRYARIKVETPDTLYVSADQLSAKLHEIQSNGNQLLLVEPVRKNLEEFFVDIVSQE